MAGKLEVIATRTIEATPASTSSGTANRRHVAYTILVKSPSDVTPLVIERRYSDFLDLYRSLRKDYPQLNGFDFPKKVLIGNFGTTVINLRRASFEAFLKIISEHERMRESSSMKKFLVGSEEKEALRLLRLECYSLARPLLVKVFSLLNKLYTERHPAVMISLCRLAACCNADTTALPDAAKFSELAIRRFESVSDVDLLRYYVPLLQMAANLWWNIGRDKRLLDARLDSLRRQGHRVDGGPDLLNAILTAEY